MSYVSHWCMEPQCNVSSKIHIGWVWKHIDFVFNNIIVGGILSSFWKGRKSYHRRHTTCVRGGLCVCKVSIYDKVLLWPSTKVPRWAYSPIFVMAHLRVILQWPLVLGCSWEPPGMKTDAPVSFSAIRLVLFALPPSSFCVYVQMNCVSLSALWI